MSRSMRVVICSLPSVCGRPGRVTSTLSARRIASNSACAIAACRSCKACSRATGGYRTGRVRSEEHTSELQSQSNLVCRLLLEKKKHMTTCTYRLHHHLLQHAI